MNYKKLLVYAPTKAIFEQALANSIADQNSVAYIEEPRMIWAQGNYYPCPYTKEEIDQLVQNNKDEFERIIAELKGNVTEEYNTLEKIENKIKEEVLRAQQKETELDTKIEAETNRAQEAENNLDQKLDQEIERAKSAESTLNQQITNEVNRAKEAEQTLTEGLNDANESIQDVRDTYLPLAGGTMSGSITFEPNINSIIVSGKTSTDLLNAAGGTTSISDLASKYVTLDTTQSITGKKVFSQGIQITSNETESTPDDITVGADLRNLANRVIHVPTAESDHFILYTGGSSDNGFTVLATGDNGDSTSEPIFITQCSGVDDTISHLITLMDENGNQKFNSVTATGYTISGKTANDLLNAAGSTTVLKTIGGESLLGEGNIELATDEDIDALFGVIDVGDE